MGPNFTEMRELILVLMSNACYLVVILIFWWLLGGYGLLPSGYCWLMLAHYLMVTGGYCSLPVVTTRYLSVLLVPTFTINNNFIPKKKNVLSLKMTKHYVKITFRGHNIPISYLT